MGGEEWRRRRKVKLRTLIRKVYSVLRYTCIYMYVFPPLICSIVLINSLEKYSSSVQTS